MKRFLAIIVGVAILISVVVLVFTIGQVQQQEKTLIDDLELRTRLLTESLIESIEPYYLKNSQKELQKVVDKFTNRERLIGIAVYDNKGVVTSVSTGLQKEMLSASPVSGQSMDSDRFFGSFSMVDKKKIYFFSSPLHDKDSVAGALVVVQNGDYIDATINQIWKNNLMRLLAQVLLYFLAIVLVLRWVIIAPLRSIIESVRLARTENIGQELKPTSHSFFRPLANEISKMSKSLLEARSVASEEARLRLEKLDTPWTEERLKEFIKAYLKERMIFVVSNREPYEHYKVKNEIRYKIPASGMVTGIGPLMEACGGMWLAQGSGDADRQTVDAHDKIRVPPDDPRYTLKRIWLTEENVKGFYYGFSNEALWPLCHMVHTRPIFRKEDWQEYREVNGKFAKSLLAEIKNIQRPLILIQDFHFALLPKMIKDSRPDAQVGIFWHVPWPNAESFSICPWRKEILEGMLGADVIGFHTQLYGNNFMDTVGKEVESLIDLEQFAITHNGHRAYVKSFPISIPFTRGKGNAKPEPKDRKILEKINIRTPYVGLGVDRMDYTKGILERFKGIEQFFAAHPDFIGQFTFLQIAPPSREGVVRYREFGEQVTQEAERINAKLEVAGWKPIVLLKEHHTHDELRPLYQLADVCMVTSLHDGMNLVAKEFVAARNDEAGVLILSQFTGAVRDLKDALVINPYSAEQTAEAIHTALIMPKDEQYRRMKKMRFSVKNYNIYRWTAELIKAVASLG